MERTGSAVIRVAFLLAAVSLCAAVPAPESHFGFRMGEDRKVADWERVVSYFNALDRSSDRILVKELGKSTEGRPFIAAFVASQSTIRDLERYQRTQKKLADPRITPPAEAEKLIAQGKSVVMITCAIHSTELASTYAAIELVYKLLTEDTPKRRAILDHTIFILVPSLNPDGLDIVTEWYRKTLGTPFEGTSPPRLYNKYVGHDNNRDWYIFSQQETRLAVSQLHNVWHPHIVYDVHQQGPNASRMFVPPWMDPIDPNIDPILAQQCNMIGMGIASDLTAAGKTGVVVNALYDFWTPARHYQAYHGGMRILTESASARLASPMTVRPDQIGRSAQGYAPRESSWNHLEPWLGGEWKLRDIVDYQLIAMESILFQAAVRREDLVRNFYRIGQRAAARQAPFAFVVPASQRDPGAAKRLLEILAFGLVEIDRAALPFEAAGKRFPAGSYVLRMQQPYNAFAKTLLEPQRYPDLRLYPGGPPKRPYDVTAHTLPLLMGVQVETVETPFTAEWTRATEFTFPKARAGAGALAASDTDSWIEVNRIWNAGGQVWRDRKTGDFYRSGRDGTDLVPVKRPRIGLYRSDAPSMDEGWTRWIFDQFEFPYSSVGNRDIRRGDLAGRYDVIVFPDQSAASIAEGYPAGSMPEEYCGGLGPEGARALKEFAAAGGELIFLNHSTQYAAGHLGIPVTNALAGVSSRDFYSPGSLLRVTLDRTSPLAYGLPREIAIWSEGSPAWDAATPEAAAVARYPRSDLLASGWLLGEKHLAGRAALLDHPVGAGRVVLFGMRPQYRAQSYQAFKLLFNALVR